MLPQTPQNTGAAMSKTAAPSTASDALKHLAAFKRVHRLAKRSVSPRPNGFVK